MIGALLGGFKRHEEKMHERHPLPGNPAQIAEVIRAQVHPTMYRRLVSDCGWSVEAFPHHPLKLVWSLIQGDR